VLPQWYRGERNQAIVDWLAFNVAVDRLAGIEPSPERWPYSLHQRETVERFLQRLAAFTTMRQDT